MLGTWSNGNSVDGISSCWSLLKKGISSTPVQGAAHVFPNKRLCIHSCEVAPSQSKNGTEVAASSTSPSRQSTSHFPRQCLVSATIDSSLGSTEAAESTGNAAISTMKDEDLAQSHTWKDSISFALTNLSLLKNCGSPLSFFNGIFDSSSNSKFCGRWAPPTIMDPWSPWHNCRERVRYVRSKDKTNRRCLLSGRRPNSVEVMWSFSSSSAWFGLTNIGNPQLRNLPSVPWNWEFSIHLKSGWLVLYTHSHRTQSWGDFLQYTILLRALLRKNRLPTMKNNLQAEVWSFDFTKLLPFFCFTTSS